MTHRLWATLIVAALGAAALTACKAAQAEITYGTARFHDIAIPPDSEVFQKTVPPRTTLAALLAEHGVTASDSAALIRGIGECFDLRRLRAGQRYRLDRFLDGRIRDFEYEIDADRRLMATRRTIDPERFEAAVTDIPKDRSVVTIAGEISSDTPSLIEALHADDGLGLALSLAEVFSGDVDFNNDLQPGDTFRLVVERSTLADGRFGGYGPILAAELVNARRPLRAIRFTSPGSMSGYYDEHGRSLKRFLLKTPLKFDPRVTSGFSRSRRHPVLQYVRAHNGVDYAAPSGAPVGAVAGGTITFAGWTPGGGRTVKVRHTSGYQSEYLHLSAIASGVRVGSRIGQGELVGRVGATGLVTGPHLHYGLKRNGVYVNPVREHLNMPPGEPIPAVHRAMFSGERDRLMQMLMRDGRARVTNE